MIPPTPAAHKAAPPLDLDDLPDYVPITDLAGAVSRRTLARLHRAAYLTGHDGVPALEREHMAELLQGGERR